MDGVRSKSSVVSASSSPPAGEASASHGVMAKGALTSEPKPLVCAQDDEPPMSVATDSPAARMAREQRAAAAAAGARQTGADGTGQGDGPSGRAERTPEQVDADKAEAKWLAEQTVEAAATAVGGLFGKAGEVAGGIVGKLLGKAVDRVSVPSAHSNNGTAGASGANPLERAWGGRY